MIVMEAALLIQPHCAQGRAYGPLSWGKRIAPAKSTWACCQTRLENSDAKGVKTCIITSGRIRIDRLFWWTAVTGVPYPFRPQMAKVQLRMHLILAKTPARSGVRAARGEAVRSILRDAIDQKKC